MKIIDLNERYIINNSKYIALGNFDGIHIAHKKILKNLINTCYQDKIDSSILLFKEHTLNSLNSNAEVLSSLDDKLELLEGLGIDYVFKVDFDSIRNMDPVEFIRCFLIQKLKVRGIFVGFDYKFGKFAKGDVKLLKSENLFGNIKIFVENPIYYKEKIVSSTKIKCLIENSYLKEAEILLGRKHFLRGVVVQGKKLGSKFGFPTANIQLLSNYSLPKEGVYFTELVIKGKNYYAATSLGKNITLEEKQSKIEAHILDFNDIIYGEVIKIRFIKKIRDMQKFNTLTELSEQVLKDAQLVRLLIGN